MNENNSDFKGLTLQLSESPKLPHSIESPKLPHSIESPKLPHSIESPKLPHSIDEILNARNQLDQIIKEKFTKDVSIMFTDICGYTKFTETRGDLAGRAMLQKHNDIVIPAIKSNNGVVIKTIGDAVMAMFDKSGDAVGAAVAVQEGLFSYNQDKGQFDVIHVKIGIHHGQVLIDEKDIFGDAVNLAARIQSLAGSDEILLSQSVHDKACVPGKIDCSFLGAVQVKGKVEPQNIYRVLWSDDYKNAINTVQVRSGINKESMNFNKESMNFNKDSMNFKEFSESSALSSTGVVSSIHIEISKVGDSLTLSVFEQNSSQTETVRVYEEVEFKTDHVSDLCSVMVNTLNLVNRKGLFPSDGMEKLRQTGQELQIALLTPKIMDMLSKTRSDHLILLLDESLIHIPWELIHDGKQFLCRKFSMGRVVKTKQSVQNHKSRTIATPMKMLIIANPENNLDGADKEGQAIDQFLNSQQGKINISHPKKEVTSKFVLDHLHYYDWVHFAGHAQYYVDNPTMNGWNLSDKVLHAREIMAISQEKPMPALVFSNACQSARNEADDSEKIKSRFQDKIYSMANALLISGVNHYIGTFWEIQDQYSQKFAISFYHSMLAGNTIGTAIKEARSAFVQAHGENAIVWASYLLYGDPRVCYIKTSDSTPQFNNFNPQDEQDKQFGNNDKSSGNNDKHSGNNDKHSGNNDKHSGNKDKSSGNNDKHSGNNDKHSDDKKISEKNKTKSSIFAACVGIILLFTLAIFSYQWNIERKITKFKAEATAYIDSAKINFQKGQLDVAKIDFERVINLPQSSESQKAEAFMGLGRIASVKGKADEALGFYEQASQYALKSAQGAPTQQSNITQQTQQGSITQQTQQGSITQQTQQGSITQQTQILEQSQIAQALILAGQKRYQDALPIFSKIKSTNQTGQSNIMLTSLINDIEQRISISKDQEKQKQIKELIASLSSGKAKTESTPPNNDTAKNNLPLTMCMMDFDTSGYSLQEGLPQLLASSLAGVLLENNGVQSNGVQNNGVQNSGIRLVERAMLDKVLEELNFGKSSLVSKDTALSVGKLMAAKTMLSGKMDFVGEDIQVSLRLIETETGQIVLSVNRAFGVLVPVSVMANELGKELSQKIKNVYPSLYKKEQKNDYSI